MKKVSCSYSASVLRFQHGILIWTNSFSWIMQPFLGWYSVISKSWDANYELLAVEQVSLTQFVPRVQIHNWLSFFLELNSCFPFFPKNMSVLADLIYGLSPPYLLFIFMEMVIERLVYRLLTLLRLKIPQTWWGRWMEPSFGCNEFLFT